MAMATTSDLFTHEVAGAFDAEQRFLQAQQEMLANASNPRLQDLLQESVDHTKQHLEGLNQVFKLLHEQPRGEPNQAADGLVSEARTSMKEAPTGPIRDAVISGAAVKAAHYGYASYRGLLTAAQQMGKPEIIRLIEANMNQEEKAAHKVDELRRHLLKEAAQAATG